MTVRHLRAATLSFTGYPEDANDPRVIHHPDAVVSMANGHFTSVLPVDAFQREGGDLALTEDLRGALIIPGLIDSHIHYPQMDVIGSYGKNLLDWLDHFAFPAELEYASREHAHERADAFMQRLFRNGTTAAVVFTTVHPHTADALFEAASKYSARIIAGKVLMDRNAPEGLLDKDTGERACIEHIERWHGHERLAYAITPRFAISCTEPQLTMAGNLLKRFDGLYLHTHLAEQLEEIELTLKLFPQCSDYLAVYERFGLVTPRSVFAHGIHLSDSELQRLAAQRAHVAFCPSSNLFLGSGLMRPTRLQRFNVGMAMGSDVGGGTSFSLLDTLGEGYKVAQLTGETLNPFTGLYAATRGAAECLEIGDRVGSLEAGFEADCTVLQPAPGSLLEKRLENEPDLTERLFASMILNGADAVRRTYVAGEPVWNRDPPSTCGHA